MPGVLKIFVMSAMVRSPFVEHGMVVGVAGGEVSLGGRGRAVLEFAVGQRAVLAAQVARLLGLSGGEAEELLAGLTGGGFLAREVFGSGEDGLFRVTAAGVRAVGGSGLPPRLDGFSRHGIGEGWLWVAARSGTFGPVDRVLSGFEMRSADRAGDAGAPFFVEPHQFGGRSGVHYPDVLAIDGSKRRLAVELLLAFPGRRELEAVLRAYAADVRMDMVLLVVVDPWLGRVAQGVIGSLGLAEMAAVQQVLGWWRSKPAVAA
jgi:hypothetical protein